MTTASVPDSSFRQYATSLFERSGFATRQASVPDQYDPVLLAENAYYLVAFQVFGNWNQLSSSISNVQAYMADLVARAEGSSKVWDTYLLFVCRSQLEPEEANALAELSYDVRNTRKIIRAGIGDEITSLDEVVRPFQSLREAQVSAKEREPLILLRNSIIDNGEDPAEVDRLIDMYNTIGEIIDDPSE